MRGILTTVASAALLLSAGAAQAQTKIGVWTVSTDKGCGMYQEWKTESKDTAKVGLGYSW